MEFGEKLTERFRQIQNYMRCVFLSAECTSYNRKPAKCAILLIYFRDEHTQTPQNINIWAGILGNLIYSGEFNSNFIFGTTPNHYPSENSGNCHRK